MGNCKTKDVIDIVQSSRDVIKTIVNLEKSDDDSQTYKALLELVLNINNYDKHTQSIILTMAHDKLQNKK